MAARLPLSIVMLAAGVALGLLVGRGLQTESPASKAGPDDPFAAAAANETTAAPPSAAAQLRAVTGAPTLFARAAGAFALAAAASAPEAEALIESAAALPPEDRNLVMGPLFMRLASLDPVAAVASLERMQGIARKVGIQAVFETLATDDLEAAVARAEALPGRYGHLAGGVILMTRRDLSRDRQQAIARRLGVESVLQSMTVMDDRVAAAEDPRSAWNAALALPDTPERHERLAAILREWAAQDPHTALTAAQSLKDADRRRLMMQRVLTFWSQRDPTAAAEWAMAQPPSAERTGHLIGTLQSLAEADPALALDLSSTLADDTRDQVTGAIVRRWGTYDPAAAATALHRVEAEQPRRLAVFSVASQYAVEDLQGAIGWLRTLAEQDAETAADAMISTLAQEDPEAARTLIDALSGSLRIRASVSFADKWSLQDPDAAFQWARDQPEPLLRTALIRTISRDWATHGVETALSRLDSLSGSAREAAALGMIESGEAVPLETAETLYRQLESSQRRLVAAQIIYRRLLSSGERARADFYREQLQSQGTFLPAPPGP